MRYRRSHPAICLVVLAAYLVNLAFVAGGAVLCSDPLGGQTRFELACNHGHCGPVIEADHDDDDQDNGHDPHDHDQKSSDACWCAACPCEDSSLGARVPAKLNDDEERGLILASSFDFELGHTPPRITPHACITGLVEPHRVPPGMDQRLRHLRTIVLIV